MDELHWRVDWKAMPWKMCTIMRWAPDATEQCAPIVGTSVANAVEVFGGSPLWVSCWACFASGLEQDDMALAMQATDRQVQRALASLLRGMRSVAEDPDQFSPVVHDVIAVLKKDAQKQQGGDGAQNDNANA